MLLLISIQDSKLFKTFIKNSIKLENLLEINLLTTYLYYSLIFMVKFILQKNNSTI
ncbi:hypothetical protein GCM10023315_12780 [Algibacter aquimarinus]|uniref:Uncharacterized protein n=1 Tax=Algibacter aquimarinus TaxID=1136748 RepID=A0ABP9HA00_9FLAO